jgi:amino acid transporter
LDAVAMVVGIVVGAGIFLLPPIVAGNLAGPAAFVGAWLAGGLISLIGALCYAELAAAYPNTGGDYYFLMRAFGAGPAFLFAWARMTVIQPGSIALFAFAIGDYVANAAKLPSGAGASQLIASLSATAVVVGLTALNVAGVRVGKWTQIVLTALVMFGLLLIVVAGSVVALREGTPATAEAATSGSALGAAMVFVLFTYSGWNEAAYLSGEMRGGRRSIVAALVLGIAAVTVMYLLVNWAYLAALGFAGVRASTAVAAETLHAAWGRPAALLITGILIVAAASSANATVFTGGRSNYALGRDFDIFRFLGQWSERTSTPRNALLVQGLLALALVGLGVATREGVKVMVDFTAPVFWFFFLLVGVGLFVLRIRDPGAERPFRVPLYPVVPAIFCAASGYLLYASLAHYRWGALVGAGVLLAGVPLMLLARGRHRRTG